MENNNFMQVVPMSYEEKFKIYMEMPHEELVKMKIAADEVLEKVDPVVVSINEEEMLNRVRIAILNYFKLYPDKILEISSHDGGSVCLMQSDIGFEELDIRSY